ILLDHKLYFHEHVTYALVKRTTWVAQFRCLAKSRYGLTFGLVKKLYLAVAVPSMLYAADIFLTPVCMLPGSKRLHGSVGVVRKLEHVQRQALLIMTGAMRTTATDVMGTHANLLPFILLVDKTEIASDKEKAIRNEGDWCCRRGIWVYSDGSDLDGGVGAAAVLFKPGRPGYKVLCFHLGSSDDHTIYQAEVVELLGAELLKEERTVEDASIVADNKSSIQATKLRRPTPGHHLLDSLHRHLCTLGRKHYDAKVTLYWVLGHVNLEGNEAADREVKHAAQGDSSPDEVLPGTLRGGLPRSVMKMKQLFLTSLQDKAKKVWTTSRWGKNFARLDKGLPSKKYEKLIGKLPRRQANILFQLHTEHIPLQKHLHRIWKADSPLCLSCLAALETVHHFLLTCPAHNCHRWEHLDHFLGHAGHSLSNLLNTSTILKPLLNYINVTGRLAPTFGNIASSKHATKWPAQRSTHG
ncbi:hypothetical protein A0H81_08075, partial [Grifola frondosa]